jgi:hypothetical protein
VFTPLLLLPWCLGRRAPGKFCFVKLSLQAATACSLQVIALSCVIIFDLLIATVQGRRMSLSQAAASALVEVTESASAAAARPPPHVFISGRMPEVVLMLPRKVLQ